MKDAAVALLELLLEGEVVEIEGVKYGMSIDYDLLVEMQKDGEPVYLKIDCDVAVFCKMAQLAGRENLILRKCAMKLRGISKT